MNTIFKLSVLTLLLLTACSRCFAMISFGYVSKARAEQLGLEVRSKAAGADTLWIEVEFKTAGELKDFSETRVYNRVELRIREGDRTVLTAALKEDRSRPGSVVVRFNTTRAQIDKTRVWVVRNLAGVADVVRLEDFIDSVRAPEELEEADIKRQTKSAEPIGGATKKEMGTPSTPSSGAALYGDYDLHLGFESFMLTLKEEGKYTLKWESDMGLQREASGDWHLAEGRVTVGPVKDKWMQVFLETYDLANLEVLKFKGDWILVPMKGDVRKFYERRGVRMETCFQRKSKSK